ncbi:mitochondrial ribonuclease P protein 1 homolog [Trichonephila clavata]|uniref:RNA (guanine-9-)-methyltransferase domain-containing protein 1 n=1 Tax=Trichonephila clavata TaxID=2740835 RepID=A0A8X6LSA3_TRICU|nr:mitochondrial ribonuclease P protein 1 homolog [Trichonephila clavata]
MHHNSYNRIHKSCFYNGISESSKEYFNFRSINTRDLTDLISDAENNDKIMKIMSEIQFASANRKRIPEYITADQVRALCNLESRTQRFEYLTFLFKKEKCKIANTEKKEKKKKERELRLLEKVNNSENSHMDYGLGRNSLLLSVRTYSMKKFYQKKLANAILLGEKIVLDLGYESYMTEKEKKACVSQLKLIYSVNRKSKDPYDLYFCNAMLSSDYIQYLKKCLQKFSDTLISLTDKSYVDLFPKEKLVYLSPHAKETMKEYDHNAVYIIGAFVDTVKREHRSLHKADKEEIKSYSLPLDEYIMWGAGSKSLTVNQVFEIMLALKNTGDWRKAFAVIPTRKIRKLEEEQIENQNIPDKIFLMNTSKNQN